MNYFTSEAAAAQYAKGRPDFHHEAITRIAAALEIEEPVERAVDVGCGTGQSTRALLPLAKEIIGLDISEAMIARARREPDPRITYIVAPAEAMPLPDASCDLATISCAFHWFDRENALDELRRMLRDGAGFAVYGNGFSGILREAPEFETWASEVHTARFPTPPRGKSFGAEGDEPEGFTLVSVEQYTHDIPLTVAQMIEYLLSQSNAIDLLERGVMTEKEARDWLTAEVTSFWNDAPDQRRTAVFHGRLWVLRRHMV